MDEIDKVPAANEWPRAALHSFFTSFCPLALVISTCGNRVICENCVKSCHNTLFCYQFSTSNKLMLTYWCWNWTGPEIASVASLYSSSAFVNCRSPMILVLSSIFPLTPGLCGYVIYALFQTIIYTCIFYLPKCNTLLDIAILSIRIATCTGFSVARKSWVYTIISMRTYVHCIDIFTI